MEMVRNRKWFIPIKTVKEAAQKIYKTGCMRRCSCRKLNMILSCFVNMAKAKTVQIVNDDSNGGNFEEDICNDHTKSE